MEFRFFVASDSTPEEILETLEVQVNRYLIQQLAMNNPYPWTDETRQIAKGRRLREIAPEIYLKLLEEIRSEHS